MRDATVSILCLLVVCASLWATVISINFLVDSVLCSFLSLSQAWFCVGFASAIAKPWDPLLQFMGRVWESIDNLVPR